MTVYMTLIPASRQVSLKPVQTGLVSSTLSHQNFMSGPCWETTTVLQRPAATQDFDAVLLPGPSHVAGPSGPCAFSIPPLSFKEPCRYVLTDPKWAASAPERWQL